MKNRIKYFLTLFSLINSPVLYAEDDKATMLEPLSAGSMLQVFSGLAAVLLLFFGLVFVLKRMGGFRASQGGKMHVVDGVSVGTRDRVLLVQVGEKQVLVGVSANGISPITVFDQPVITVEDIAENGFAGQLQKQLKNRLNPQSDKHSNQDQKGSDS